ncbi:MAG: HEAT repeat domain-containing protein [Planctomycetota bacterium]|nr:HEAT repeat domain-containing protein [Planctomycetota bacterium]
MIEAPTRQKLQLLTDEQVRQFVTLGFVQLKTNLPREHHQTVFNKLDAAAQANGHTGNNALPTIPELADVLDDPAVRGAFASVLGPSAVLHQHRFMHGNHPGQNKAPGWHKDSYWGYHGRLRSHRPWWAMIMYYPQDTGPENGPTAVLPGRQHHSARMPNDDRGWQSVTGEAGTFFLIHYDLWHAAWPNTSDRRRFMCKFEFLRLDPPDAPSWQCEDRTWREPAEAQWPLFSHRLLWRRVWDWVAGNAPSTPAIIEPDASIETLRARLASEDRVIRGRAADALGSLGPAALPAAADLLPLLSEHLEFASHNATYALAAIGAPAAKLLPEFAGTGDDLQQRHAALALGEIGSAALDVITTMAANENPRQRAAAAYALGAIAAGGPRSKDDPAITAALTRLTADADDRTRLWAVEALGHRGVASVSSVPALIDRLADVQTEIRFFAPLSLARIGPKAAEAVPALTKCLRDENRYVRGHALEALRRIDTPEARSALIDFLMASRWCPSTTPDSPFFP